MDVKEELRHLVEESRRGGWRRPGGCSEIWSRVRRCPRRRRRRNGLRGISAIVQKRKEGTMTEEERLELVNLACGMSAHLPGSVDEFLREKHEETEREEARWAARQRERAA